MSIDKIQVIDNKQESQIIIDEYDNNIIVKEDISNVSVVNEKVEIVVPEEKIEVHLKCSASKANINFIQKVYKTYMTDAVVLYTLPESPDISLPVLPFVNGILVDFNLTGVNITIITYPAGDIESTDELYIYYWVAS